MGQWVVCWLDGVLGQIPSEPTRYLGQTDNLLAKETNVSLSPVLFLLAKDQIATNKSGQLATKNYQLAFKNCQIAISKKTSNIPNSPKDFSNKHTKH